MSFESGESQPNFGVSRLARETLHDRAYQELKKAIMAGVLVPGSAMTIRALAAALGTSPMPVREALRRLVTERALEVLPNRSVSIPVMTAEKFQEISMIRIALEGMAAERAAGRIAPEDVGRMEHLNREMMGREAARKRTYLAKNQEFHFLLYRNAGMPQLVDMIESLWLQTGPLLNHVVNAAGVKVAADHHGAALAALRRRDGAATRAAIEADIRDAATMIVGYIEKAGAPTRA